MDFLTGSNTRRPSLGAGRGLAAAWIRRRTRPRAAADDGGPSWSSAARGPVRAVMAERRQSRPPSVLPSPRRGQAALRRRAGTRARSRWSVLLTIHAAFAMVPHAAVSWPSLPPLPPRSGYRTSGADPTASLDPALAGAGAAGCGHPRAAAPGAPAPAAARSPPQDDRVIALVVVLHVFFLLALWSRDAAAAAAAADRARRHWVSALQVRFVPRARPPARRHHRRRRCSRAPTRPRPSPNESGSRGAARRCACSARMDRPPAAAASSVRRCSPRLYDRDGAALLPPPASAWPQRLPGYVQRKPTGDTQVMEHSSPLPYKATRFEKYFPPPGENAAQAGMRHVLTPLFKQHDGQPAARRASEVQPARRSAPIQPPPRRRRRTTATSA